MFGSTVLRARVSTVFLLLTLGLLPVATSNAQGQAYDRELSISGKSLTIKNRTGRVSVIASDSEKDKPSLKATSAGGSVEPSDIVVSGNEITVRERPYRIDLTVRVPKRARVKVSGSMIDVIGDFESEVVTNTGTIHADVPTDAESEVSVGIGRPRFSATSELPRVKEGRAGAFRSQVRSALTRRKKDKNRSQRKRDADKEKHRDGNGDKAVESNETSDGSDRPLKDSNW
jgi:hypothetical protein